MKIDFDSTMALIYVGIVLSIIAFVLMMIQFFCA